LRHNDVLRVLDLDCNLICDDGAIALAKLLESSSTLAELDLHFNNISGDGTAELAEALRSNHTLVSLSLTGNPVGDDGAVHLAHALTENTCLRELHLADVGISDRGGQHLAMALEANTALVSLHLNKNRCGNPSAEYFATALAINRSLQELWLLNNDITQVGAKQLMMGVKGNKTLHRLGLTVKSPCTETVLKDFRVQHAVRRAVNHVAAGGTKLTLDGQVLGDDGVTQLLGSLHKEHTLEELQLKNTGVGNIGACRLAEAMDQGRLQLRVLNLEQNDIGDRGAVRLAEALERNNSLESLSLAGNSLTDIGRTRLVLARENSATLHELYLPENEITDIDGALSKLTEGRLAEATETKTAKGPCGVNTPETEAVADEHDDGIPDGDLEFYSPKTQHGHGDLCRNFGDDDSVASDVEEPGASSNHTPHQSVDDSYNARLDFYSAPPSSLPDLRHLSHNDSSDVPPALPIYPEHDDFYDIPPPHSHDDFYDVPPPQSHDAEHAGDDSCSSMPDDMTSVGEEQNFNQAPPATNRRDGAISLGEACEPIPLPSDSLAMNPDGDVDQDLLSSAIDVWTKETTESDYGQKVTF